MITYHAQPKSAARFLLEHPLEHVLDEIWLLLQGTGEHHHLLSVLSDLRSLLLSHGGHDGVSASAKALADPP
jgi:hypothetical protein